ncbi:MAG: hypothetical protein MRJ93_11525 [Nitrososphaeraceae archaeon]|nr:hypothetical protein [Nitrososphaeraceae archaeon]
MPACLADLDGTADLVVTLKLTKTQFDGVMIGDGIRTIPEHLLLFEKLINLVHQYVHTAKICFNTKPSDTADAVQRWFKP